MEKKKSKSNVAAFDFFWGASNQDIVDLGWRIGEKMDSVSPWEEIIIPLCKGVADGSLFPIAELQEFIAAQQSRKASGDRSSPIHKDWDTPEEDEAWKDL